MSKKITPLSNFLTLFEEGVYAILLIISIFTFLARFRHYIEENEETRKNDMKKAILTLAVSIFLTLFHHPSFAQQMNLLQCMEYALAHSLSIQQSETALSNAELDHKAAVAAFFPTLSASTSASLSFGRAIDPADKAAAIKCIESESESVTQWCLTLCNSTDYSPPGSSVHGILQARILE